MRVTLLGRTMDRNELIIVGSFDIEGWPLSLYIYIFISNEKNFIGRRRVWPACQRENTLAQQFIGPGAGKLVPINKLWPLNCCLMASKKGKEIMAETKWLREMIPFSSQRAKKKPSQDSKIERKNSDDVEKRGNQNTSDGEFHIKCKVLLSFDKSSNFISIRFELLALRPIWNTK